MRKLRIECVEGLWASAIGEEILWIFRDESLCFGEHVGVLGFRAQSGMGGVGKVGGYRVIIHL